MSENQAHRTQGLLEIKDLTRAFGGLMAVSDLDLSIRSGEFFGLIGPNGAGKTTVFNLISGVLPLTKGRIHLDGKDITGAPTHTITRLGLARTFQLTALFKSFSVLDNVLLGTYGIVRVNPLASLLNTGKVRAVEKEQRERALHWLQIFGIERLGGELAGNLPLGHQRILELAMALAGEPKMLLLDEPFSGLSAEEGREMIERIQKIRENRITVMLVEHNIKIVMGLCDRIAVLNFGRKIAEGTFAAVSQDPAVIKAYLGTKRYADHSKSGS
jgi:ABC-type branched-subunit amino acid transport system ATPase component